MITSTDRKIMMLKKMATRLKNQKLALEKSLAAKDTQLNTQHNKIQVLIQRIKGDGAKAPIPDELLDSYRYALDYVTRNNYPDGSQIAVFKRPDVVEGPLAQMKGQTVVEWAVNRIDTGIYDLTVKGEWVY